MAAPALLQRDHTSSQPTSAVVLLCLSSLYNIPRTQQTFWVENHISLCLHFAESSLGLQPLLRSKAPAKRTRPFNLPEHQHEGCSSLLHPVQSHKKLLKHEISATEHAEEQNRHPNGKWKEPQLKPNHSILKREKLESSISPCTATRCPAVRHFTLQQARAALCPMPH